MSGALLESSVAMHMIAVRVEDAQEAIEDDGVRVIGGLVLGLAISALMWLVLLMAWLFLN